MANKLIIHSATVLNKKILESGFIRIKLSCEDSTISEQTIGGYIKLIIINKEKEFRRTITVSGANDKERSFTLDFVNHGRNGPAASWARNAISGTSLRYLGPGPVADVDLTAKHHLLISDPSGLPALKRQLERLQAAKYESCSVYLVDIAPSQLDYFHPLRESQKVQFFKTRYESLEQDIPFDEIKPDATGLWAVGDRLSIKIIRGKVKEVLARKKEKLRSSYISSYWQRGLDQEEHTRLKQQDTP